jgi:hypothetical protein
LTNRNLYLYEVVDIVGQGQYEYMEHLWTDPVLQMPEMNNLQGSFFICAQGGGRWPQVINIWDMGNRGWMSWASNVDRLNLKRRKIFYNNWWSDAAKWRTGGFDRVCGSVPGCPTTAELAERGVKGTLFVNEILTVRPGTQLEFLAAVVEERVPLLREYGHEPTGIYEVTNNSHEVVMVWATEIRHHTRFHQNRDTTLGLCDEGEVDERTTAWERRSAQYVTGGDTQVMTPLPRTVYGPPDWDDTSQDDWLSGNG